MVKQLLQDILLTIYKKKKGVKQTEVEKCVLSVEEAINEIIGSKISLDKPINLEKGQHIFVRKKEGKSQEKKISQPLEIFSIQENDNGIITSFNCYPDKLLQAGNEILLKVNTEEETAGGKEEEVFIIKSSVPNGGFAKKNRLTRERFRRILSGRDIDTDMFCRVF